jgi:hypothetical protein
MGSQLLKKVKTYAWKCIECKRCEVCKIKGEDVSRIQVAHGGRLMPGTFAILRWMRHRLAWLLPEPVSLAHHRSESADRRQAAL